MPKLVLKLDDRTNEIPLTGSELVVGRGGECDVPLPVEGMSRRHFRVFKQNLVWYVEDLGSRNGTRYESEMLGRSPKALVHGARLIAGAAAFIFHDDSALNGALDDEEERFKASEAPTAVFQTASQVDPKKETKKQPSPTAPTPRTPVKPVVEKPTIQAPAAEPEEELPYVWFDVQVEAAAEPKRITMTKTSFSFGRADDNDVVLHDPMISSHHAVVEAEGEAHVLRDLGTSNGTFIGKERTRIEAAELRDRSVFLLAKAVRVVYRNPALNQMDLDEPQILPAEIPHEDTPPVEQATPATPASPSANVGAWIEVKTEAAAEPVRYDIGETLTIGRADDNDIVLHDPMVSSHHAVVEPYGEFHALRDLGTPNGTFISHTRERITFAELREGEVLWAAKAVRITYHNPAMQGLDLPEPHVELAVPTKPASISPPTPPSKDKFEQTPASSKSASEKRSPILVRSGPSWKGVFLLLIFAAGVLGGSAWMLPEVIQNFMRQKEAQSSTNLARQASNALLSFERVGEMGGWRLLKTEGAVVKAGVDKLNVSGEEGVQSLAISLQNQREEAGAPIFSISTQELVGLNFEGEAKLTGHFAGEIKGAASIGVSFMGDRGTTICVGQSALVVAGKWGKQSVDLRLPREVSDWGQAVMVLTFHGDIQRLWIDDLQLERGEGERGPTQALRGYKLDERVGASTSFLRGSGTGNLQYDTGTGWKGELRPALLGGSESIQPRLDRSAFDVRDLQHPSWVFDSSQYVGRSFESSWMMPMRLGESAPSSSRGMRVSASIGEEGTSPETYAISYDFSPGLIGAVEFEADLSFGDDVVIFDRRGNEIPVQAPIDDRLFVSAGPIGEVLIGSISIAVPSNVELGVQVAEHRPERHVLLRFFSLGEESGEDISLQLSRKARTRGVIYKRIFDQMNTLRSNRRFTASRLRAQFLSRLDARDWQMYHDRGTEVESDLKALLDRMWQEADDLMERAESRQDINEASSARAKYQQIAAEFNGDPSADTARRKALEASRFISRVKAGGEAVDTTEEPAEQSGPLFGSVFRGEKPREPDDSASREIAEENATALLGLAQKSFDSGNWILAYVFADNVQWNYHFTRAAGDAKSLLKKIDDEWNNKARERAYVAEQMKNADAEAQAFNAKGAREVYLAILQRYPRCPERLDILARLRILEGRARR